MSAYQLHVCCVGVPPLVNPFTPTPYKWSETYGNNLIKNNTLIFFLLKAVFQRDLRITPFYKYFLIYLYLMDYVQNCQNKCMERYEIERVNRLIHLGINLEAMYQRHVPHWLPCRKDTAPYNSLIPVTHLPADECVSQ